MILDCAKEEQALYTLCSIHEFTKERNVGEIFRSHSEEVMTSVVYDTRTAPKV